MGEARAGAMPNQCALPAPAVPPLTRAKQQAAAGSTAVQAAGRKRAAAAPASNPQPAKKAKGGPPPAGSKQQAKQRQLPSRQAHKQQEQPKQPKQQKLLLLQAAPRKAAQPKAPAPRAAAAAGGGAPGSKQVGTLKRLARHATSIRRARTRARSASRCTRRPCGTTLAPPTAPEPHHADHTRRVPPPRCPLLAVCRARPRCRATSAAWCSTRRSSGCVVLEVRARGVPAACSNSGLVCVCWTRRSSGCVVFQPRCVSVQGAWVQIQALWCSMSRSSGCVGDCAGDCWN